MIRQILCIGIILSIAGCGYTTGSLLPAKYKKIAIQPFQNKINNIDENNPGLYVPALETDVRTAIINRFVYDGNLHVADPEKADLVLNGNLISIQQDTLRQDINQNVQEYRITITVSLTMTDVATGEVLWAEPSFAGETTYFLSGTQATSQSAAIQAALTDLATRVVERTVENW